MSDRTFRFAITITDDNGVVTSEEFVSFDPHDTDEYGNNETVIMAVEAWLKRAKYDAQQLDIEDEQNAEYIRSDFEEHNTHSYAYSGAR